MGFFTSLKKLFGLSKPTEPKAPTKAEPEKVSLSPKGAEPQGTLETRVTTKPSEPDAAKEQPPEPQAQTVTLERAPVREIEPLKPAGTETTNQPIKPPEIKPKPTEFVSFAEFVKTAERTITEKPELADVYGIYFSKKKLAITKRALDYYRTFYAPSIPQSLADCQKLLGGTVGIVSAQKRSRYALAIDRRDRSEVKLPEDAERAQIPAVMAKKRKKGTLEASA